MAVLVDCWPGSSTEAFGLLTLFYPDRFGEARKQRCRV
jgi:hypothetical protein